MMVSGNYFPVLGSSRRSAGSSRRRRPATSAARRVVVLGYDYWTIRFGAGPRRSSDQTIIVNGQVADDRRRRAARLRRHDARHAADGLRADHDARAAWSRRLRRASTNRRNYWVYLFARLKPGVTIEQARAALNVPYHAIVNDVEAPLQKGMSDQTMAQFETKPLVMAPGARGQSYVCTTKRGRRSPAAWRVTGSCC